MFTFSIKIFESTVCTCMYMYKYVYECYHQNFCIVGESNPPEVWKFLESVGEKWSALALFMGYQREHISSLTSQFPGLNDQLQQFLRVWRVPDCKTQTTQILGRLLEAFEAHQVHVHCRSYCNLLVFSFIMDYTCSCCTAPVSSDSGYVEHTVLRKMDVLY